jgi:hypothetical protein
MIEYITDEEGNEIKKVTTVQENGWTRVNYYHKDGTVEEIYEGKKKKEYDSNKKYSFYYHYMHDYPSCIVKVECEGCLIERTLKLLQRDPMVVIGSIEEIEK